MRAIGEEEKRQRADEELRESEEKYKVLAESITDAFFAFDKDLRYTYWNKASEELTGIPTEDALGKHIHELFPDSEMTKSAEKMYLKALRTQKVQSFVNEYQLGGKNYFFEINAYPSKNGLSVFTKDITERKLAEEALQQSNKRFTDIAENALEWIWEVDARGKYTYASPIVGQILGYKPEEVVGKHFYDLFHPDDREELKKVAFAAFAEKQPFRQFVNRNIRKNGEIVWLSTSAVPILDEKGTLLGYRGADVDITKRKRAEDALRESEAFRSGLLANSPIPVAVINPDGSIRYVSPALEKLTGFSAQELIGRTTPYPYWPRERRQKIMEGFRRAMSQGSKGVVELYQRKNGEKFWVEITSTPVKEDGKFQYLLASWVDITERERAEETLRESEARYRAVIEGAHDMIQSISLDGRIIFVNKSWRDTLGYTEAELSSLNLFDIIHPDSQAHCRELFAKVMSGKSVHGIEAAFLTKDGRKILVEGNAAPRYIGKKVVASQGIFRDVTESKLKEKDYQNIIHTTTDGFWIVDSAGRFLDVNDAYCALVGYSREELLNMRITDIEAVEKPEDTARRIRRIIKTGHDRFETRHKCKDGRIVDIEVSTTYAGAGDGRLFVFIRDITVRKQIEDELQAEKNKLQSVIDAMVDHLTIRDKDYNLIYQSESSQGVFGNHLGEKCYRVYEGQDELCDNCPVEKAFKDGKSHTSERKTVTPSGEVIFWETTANLIRDAKGEIVSCLEVARDITEHKNAEEALADEATRHHILIDQSSDGIVILDGKGGVYEANRQFAEMLGYTPEEVRELHLWDWDAHFKREQLDEMVASVGPEGDHFETQHRRKDGTVFDVEISTNGAVYAGQKLIFCVCRDITARKQTEAALKESEEKYKTLVEATSDIIWEVDEKGTFSFVSPKIKDVLGYEVDEVVGKMRTLDLIPKGEARRWLKRFKEVNAKGTPFFGLEIAHLHKNGTYVIFETSGIPLFDSAGNLKGFVGINKDITERRQMQEQLVIADRLASVGELAAGIAHELNNPLTGVIGFSQLLLDKEMPADIKEDIEVVYSEAQRASQVVKNLLTFARKHTAAKEKVNINDIINKVLELRAYEQKLESITVDARLDANLPEVMADYFQLQQVFLNIVINAEYFMKEANHKGNLTITTEKVGNKIRASFADDGPGIADENLGHLFDPFFTTKEVGRGTGLGLSICHGIVAEHGGRIYVESELGKGTAFIVELAIGAAERKGGAA